MAAVPELLEQQDEDRSKVRSFLLRYLPRAGAPAGLPGLPVPSWGFGRSSQGKRFKPRSSPPPLFPFVNVFMWGSQCTLILWPGGIPILEFMVWSRQTLCQSFECG